MAGGASLPEDDEIRSGEPDDGVGTSEDESSSSEPNDAGAKLDGVSLGICLPSPIAPKGDGPGGALLGSAGIVKYRNSLVNETPFVRSMGPLLTSRRRRLSRNGLVSLSATEMLHMWSENSLVKGL